MKGLILQTKLKLIDQINQCMTRHYCYFKDIAYKFQPHVCNKYHDISIMTYEWKNIELIDVKGFD